MATNKTNKIEVVNSLVLAYFSTTAPATTALNRSATERVTNAAGAAKHAARVYNTVLQSKGTAIGKAISLLQRTGVALRQLGLPCKAGGFYLPVRDIQHAQNLFDDAMLELDSIKEDILKEYPVMEAAVRKQLNDFAKEIEIPPASAVVSRFTMTMTIVNCHSALDNKVLSGVAKEVANRVMAESKAQTEELLRQAHAGPVADLRAMLDEFSDRMRNAQRLHLTQFDKLRDEIKRVKGLNVLNLPEVNALLAEAAKIAATPLTGLTGSERTEIANQADSVSQKADATLAALGL